MSSVVHFKFSSSTSYDSISFEGAFITVAELKVLITEKKSLSRDATAELVLSDPRTKAVYEDDTAIVPKSSSVLVKRVPNLHNTPLLPQDRKGKAIQAAPAPITEEPVLASAAENGKDDFGEDLFAEQRGEDAALAKLLEQTGQQWESEVRQSNVRGRGRGRGRGDFGGRASQGRGRGHEPAQLVLPKGYICYRCGQQGHHITDCPTNSDPDFKRIRPAIGVPSMLLQQKEGGGLLLPDGTLGSMQANEDAFRKEVGLMAPQPAGESTAKPSDRNAIVLAGEAGPVLAGQGELAMPDMLMLPPGSGLPAPDMLINGGPPMPLPLPDLASRKSGPMSREEFERLREFERLQSHMRKVDRLRRSDSPSRSPPRRRRDRSRSPRKRDYSPYRGYRSRRHYSRERSSSRDRLPYHHSRRASPNADRRWSRSPIRSYVKRSSPIRSRRASRSPVVSQRKQASQEKIPARWQPREDVQETSADRQSVEQNDVFGAAFEDELPLPANLRTKDAEKESASPDLSEPQLIGAALPTLLSDSLDFRGGAKNKKGPGLGIASRLKPIGAVQPVSEPEASKGSRKMKSLTTSQIVPRAVSPADKEHSSPKSGFNEDEPKKKGPLPKTFTIPFENGKLEKEKKSKSSKDKSKKHKRREASVDKNPPAEDEDVPKKRRKVETSPEEPASTGRFEAEAAPTDDARDTDTAANGMASTSPHKLKDKLDELERYRQESSMSEDELTVKVEKPKKKKHKEHKTSKKQSTRHKESRREKEEPKSKRHKDSKKSSKHKEKRSKSKHKDKS